MKLSLRITAFATTSLAVAVAALLATSLPVRAAQSGDPAANSPEFYTAKVKPIFSANCFRCHAGLNHRGGLTMDTKAGILRGGRDGAAIVPGDPENSLLIKLIRHADPNSDPGPMPPKSKLSDADIATVTQWIKAGAVMPDDQ